MNEIDKVIEILKENYDEATSDEWMADLDGNKIMRVENGEKHFYFKPKEVFPKVFENGIYEFTLFEDGEVNVEWIDGKRVFHFLPSESVQLAYEVFKQAMELKNKEKNEFQQS